MRGHPSARARRLSRRDTAFVGAPAALRRCTQPLGERERSGEGYAHRDRMRGNGRCDSSARSRRSRAMEESRRGGDPRRAAWMHGREIPVNLDDACAFDGYEARARVEPCAVRRAGCAVRSPLRNEMCVTPFHGTVLTSECTAPGPRPRRQPLPRLPLAFGCPLIQDALGLAAQHLPRLPPPRHPSCGTGAARAGLSITFLLEG